MVKRKKDTLENKEKKSELIDSGRGEEYSSEDIKGQMIFNLPNILTLIRIVLAPVFMLTIIYHMYTAAVIVLTVAALTDFFDGFTARKFNMRTKIGAILDPIADILFMTFTLIALVISFSLPLWFASVIFFRDGLILLGGLSLHFLKAKYPKENTVGKVARFMQLVTIIIYVIAHIYSYESQLIFILMYATALITLASIAIYIDRGYRMIKERVKR